MPRAHYDAIVVGSGANGGVAALELTRAGLEVLVIEAGPVPRRNPYGTPAVNLARRLTQRWLHNNQQIQECHAAYWELNPELFVDDKKNPYTTPEEMPYRWIRGRQLGGRSHTWGGCTLRLSDYEFKSSSRDGIGSDWPISTADLAPYYERLERFFVVHGNCDRLKQLPDGNFLEAASFSPGELDLRGTLKNEFGRDVVISRGIRALRQREVGKQYSLLSSPGTSLAVVAGTNKLTIETGAIVCRLLKSPHQPTVNCVEYINAETRKLDQVTGAVIFLCASTIESLRILMLSDLGNQSGLLGKGLMDNIVCNLLFHMPEVPDVKGYTLTGGDSILVPRYQNLARSDTSFRGGFGYWGGVNRLWPASIMRKRPGIALGFLCGMGETSREETNEVALDPLVRDEWGIPVPRISCKWTPNDLRLCEVMRSDAEEMIRAIGGELTTIPEALWTPFLTRFMGALHKDWELTMPGQFVHEVGGARMGTVREESVLNSYGQLWESPNVFVTDGACWVTSSWQNPTLTEMAITARATERAISELKLGNL
jgi:choline dehydrogenase-like flavoprotein